MQWEEVLNLGARAQATFVQPIVEQERKFKWGRRAAIWNTTNGNDNPASLEVMQSTSQLYGLSAL